jgi:hypothetical protein
VKTFHHEQWTPCQCEKTDIFGPHYVEEGGMSRHIADNAAAYKRLTSAEIAAEMFRALFVSAVDLTDGDLQQSRRAADQARVWERFAIHPHAHTGEH